MVETRGDSEGTSARGRPHYSDVPMPIFRGLSCGDSGALADDVPPWCPSGLGYRIRSLKQLAPDMHHRDVNLLYPLSSGGRYRNSHITQARKGASILSR